MASASPRRVPGDLGEVFNRRRVRSLAGPRSFERGEDYGSGTVTKLRVTATSAEATVRGSAPYKVRLSIEDGDPVFSCTCPVGAEGSFCKHAVALALVATEPGAAEGPKVEPQVDVRAYLEGLEHERLVDLVLEIASADELALARLRLDAAKAVSGPPPLRVRIPVIPDTLHG